MIQGFYFKYSWHSHQLNLQHFIEKIRFNILLALVLLLGSFTFSFSQSGSYGSTFVFQGAEVGIYGQHNFQDNLTGTISAGIIGSERTTSIGVYSFIPPLGSWISASNSGFVDGYVRTYRTDGFVFPIGDGNNYRPAAVSAASMVSPATAAYYGVNPTLAVTSSLKGGNEPILPTGGPFASASKQFIIENVSVWEYWDINGSLPAKISLTWNANSNVATMTGNNLAKLTIVGWDGTKWVKIPSAVDIQSLQQNTSATSFSSFASNITDGSITTINPIIPDTYSVYTLASTSLLCDISIADADCDGDGVSNIQESIDGTNALDSCSFNILGQFMTPSIGWLAADCDGDNISNGIEKTNGTNPLDPCSPGISISPSVVGAQIYTGTATYVATAIDVSGMTSNGGNAIATYSRSSISTGTNPTIVGSSYPLSFTQTFKISDVIPTDAIALTNLTFSSTGVGNGNITGGLQQKKLELKVDPVGNTYVLNKNINWENTAFGPYNGILDIGLKAVYDNSISGTVGVGPLTIPAYVPNINVSPPLTGNWVTTMQYGISAGIQSSLPTYFSYPTGNTWQHFNSGSADGGNPVNSFKKAWSFDKIKQSSVLHKAYEFSSSEIVFAEKAAPYISTGFGITNSMQPLDQVLQFNKSVLIKNICPANTFNLNSLISATPPVGTSLVWFTNDKHLGTPVSNPTSVPVDTFYAFYFNATTGCYGPPSAEVILTNEPCVNANPDINQTMTNVPVSGTVATNDLVKSSYTFMQLGNTLRGNIVINSDGTYTYTPNPNFVGTDSVKYKVCEPAPYNYCDTSILVIEVRPMTTAPGTNSTIAQNDHAATPINTSVNLCIKCNDSDPQGNNIGNPTLIGSIPSGVILNPNGTITYTPTLNFVGQIRFNYSVCDNGVPMACDTATVYIDVTPTPASENQTYANDDANSTPINTTVNGDVSTNDTDPQSSDLLNFSMIGTPVNGGSVTLNSNGSYVYNPPLNYTGTDRFTYRKCDNGNPVVCDTATVYLSIFNPCNISLTNVTTDSTNPTACSGNDGTIKFNNVIPSNATLQFSYKKNNIVIGPIAVTVSNGMFTLTGLSAATYTQFIFTDPANVLCKDTVDLPEGRINLVDPPLPTMSGLTPMNPTTCSGTNGNIMITGVIPNSGNYSVTYTKDGAPQSGTFTAVAGKITIPNLGAGSYNDFVISQNSCISSALVQLVSLTDPLSPSGAIAGPDTACISAVTGLYSISALTNCSTCSYTWSSTSGIASSVNGASTNFVFTSTGLQTIQVAIRNTTTNCTTILTKQVNIMGTPVINGVNQQACIGFASTITINASVFPSVLLEYSLDGGAYQLSNTFASVPNGNHTINARVKGTSCTSTNFSFTINCACVTPPSVSISGPVSICNAETATLVGTLTNASLGTWQIISGGGSLSTTTCLSSGCQSIYTPSISGIVTIRFISNDPDGTGPCDADTALHIMTVLTTPSISSNTFVNPITCGGCNGSITLNGNLPNGNYTVNYTKDGNAQSVVKSASANAIIIDNLCSGTYSNFVVTLNNCPSAIYTPTINLTDPLAPSGNITGPTAACMNTAIGNYSVAGLTNCTSCQYQWSSSVGVASSPTASTTSFTFSTSGIQSIELTITNPSTQCSTTLVYSVFVNGLPTINSVVQGACIGNTATMTVNASVSPSATLEYSLDNSSYQSSNIFTGVSNGTHSMKVRIVGTLCESSPTYSFVVDCQCTNPAQAIISGPLSTCANAPLLLTGNFVNASSGTWSVVSGGGSISPTACSGNGCNATFTPDANILNVTQVQISLTSNDPDGVGPCQAAISYHTITVNPVPVISGLTQFNPTSCGVCDGSITISGLLSSQNYTVSYAGPAGIYSGNLISNINGQITISNLCVGTYSNIIVSKSGCSSAPRGPLTLVNPNSPPKPNASSNSPICSGANLQLITSGSVNASYNWTGPNGFNSSLQNPIIVGAIISNTGIYCVSQTVNGCKGQDSCFTVIINQTPFISGTSTVNPTTCGGSNGSITLSGLNPNTPYVLYYVSSLNGPHSSTITSTSAGQIIISNLPSAIYSLITVTSNSCTSPAVGPIILTDPGNLSAPSASSNSPVCERGTITLNAFGQAGASFAWSGPNGFTASGSAVNINNAQPSISGNYLVTQTVNNCVSPPATINVVVNPAAVINLNISDASPCYNQSVTLSADYDINTLNIFWYKQGSAIPIGTGFNPIVVKPGIGISYYRIVATTSFGCTQLDTVYVNVKPCISPDINQTTMNTPVSGTVATNDEYPIGSTFMIVNNSPNGTMNMLPNGSYTFTPNLSFIGTATYSYKVCTSANVCDTATLTIEVRPVQSGPMNTVIAQDDDNSTPLNTSITSCILCNDSDPQGNAIGTPVLIPGGTIPSGSTVVLNPNASITFTPPMGYTGTVIIPYSICDNGIPQACDTAKLMIEVLSIPISDNQTYANDDAFVTIINTVKSGDVSLNDSDPQNDVVIFAKVSNPLHGSVTVNSDGTYNYNPTSGYTGPDQFIYKKCDSGIPSVCDTATVYITVQSPYLSASPDINQTAMNTPVSGTVATNDEYPVGSTFVIVNINPYGMMNMLPNGTYTFTPNPGFIGTATYTYKVCTPSPTNVCDTTSLTIEVRPVQSGPMNTVIAQDDENSTPLNTSITSCILCNDSDPQGNAIGTPVLLSGATIPSGSTVVLNPNGTVSYTPPTGFVGIVTIPYSICDNGIPQACDTAKLMIEVLATPITQNQTYANDDAFTSPVNTKLNGNVSLNDSDPQGDAAMYTVVGNPTNGILMLNMDGTFMFTPTPSYTGPAGFTYSKCDKGTPSVCDTATVYITVQSPYISASPDINQMTMNTPVSGAVATNDEYPIGSTFAIVNNNPNGTMNMLPNGTYTFTPNAGFIGTATYTYKVCTPSPTNVCDTTSLTIEVRPVQSGPMNTVIAQDDENSTPLNTSITSCILCNDSDPQGNAIGTPVLLSGATIPSGSTVVLNPNGTVSYTPPTGFVGIVTIPYSICDNGIPQACDTAKLMIEVLATPITQNQTYANDDAFTSPVNTKLNGNVSLNDSDPQGDAAMYTVVGNPANGTLMLNMDGTFMFTPTPSYTGPAGFTYSKCDKGTPSVCDTATVYITVQSPYISASPDINQTTMNTPVSGTVATNDEYPVGSTFAIVNNNPNGTMNLLPNGTYTFTPNAGFIGTARYTYKVCTPSPTNVCDTTTLTIEVRPVQSGPMNTVIAQDDENSTPLNTIITSCILCNDSDPQGNAIGTPVLISGETIPSGSTVVLNPNGTVTFTPPTGYVGIVTIPYSICDNGIPQACDTAKLMIEVLARPITQNQTYANDDAYSGSINTKLSGNVSLNDSDPQGDAAMYTVVGNPTNGILMLNMDGAFMFTPTPGYTGPAGFTYSKCDKGLPSVCDTASVYITFYQSLGVISDLVWRDLNGNGIQDIGEPGQGNVIVKLVDCSNGNITAKDTTDINGKYAFDRINQAGNYYLRFDLSNTNLTNHGFTFSNIGTNPNFDSDANSSGVTSCINIGTGQIIDSIDAGIIEFSRIGDYVWNDINGDGIQSFGENGLAGVTVQLIEKLTNNIQRTFITGTNGQYTFDKFMPGQYFVKYTLPSDYKFTSANIGNDFADSDVDGSNGLGTTATTFMSPGEDDRTMDAGAFKCAVVSGDVWYDLNKDGIYQDIENGINGLSVYLIDANSNTIVDVSETGPKPGTPSDDGFYSFSCVKSGSYYVRFDRPGDLAASAAFQGTNRTKDSHLTHAFGPNTSELLTLTSGSIVSNFNAGFQVKAVVGNFVWLDSNQNGLQDNGEKPVQGVKVMAMNSSGTIVSESTTGVDGVYTLDGIAEGDYYVKFQAQSQYGFTTPNKGSDEIDSDVSGTFGAGTTAIVQLHTGDLLNNIDAGLTLAVLPIEWIDFTGSFNGTFTKLSWITGIEINNDYYIVERRHETEKNFRPIGKEFSSANQNASQHDYFYDDYDLSLDGIYYYRIMQVDKDGLYTYSKVIAIKKSNSYLLNVEIYPNPVKEFMKVEIEIGKDGMIESEILDETGRIILTPKFGGYKKSGKYSFNIDSDILTSGSYIFKIKNPQGTVNKKFVVTK